MAKDGAQTCIPGPAVRQVAPQVSCCDGDAQVDVQAILTLTDVETEGSKRTSPPRTTAPKVGPAKCRRVSL